MRTHPLPERLALLSALLLALLVGPPLLAQEVREVVSSRIGVSARDATLSLELAPDEAVEVAFRDGEVLVDGEPLGSYERGDALDSAWRSLLSEAVELEGEALSAALVEWTPPADLAEPAAAVGRRLDRALDERLTESGVADRALRPLSDTATESAGAAELASLLRRTERLALLAGALEGLRLENVRVRVGEDVVVESGEEVEATVIVVDGSLEIRGAVEGDVVVAGGELRVLDGGRIDGDVRLAEARISREEGEIAGSVREVEERRSPAARALEDPSGLRELEELDGLEEEIRTRLREELRDELRSELRSEVRDRSRGGGVFAPLRSVGRGLAGLLQNLVTFAIVVVLGGLAVHFFPANLERVTAAARRTPARAGVVGLAGAFLLVPVYILGIVALAISIVGIPALVAWIPLFPVAAGLAAGLGYLAVASAVGEWIAGRRIPGLDFLRPSNAIHTLAAGVAFFLVPFAAANVVEMGGRWLGFVEGLLLAVGWTAGAVAVAVGFGAVLLTRGGRQPHPPTPGAPYGGPGPDPGPRPTARAGAGPPPGSGPADAAAPSPGAPPGSDTPERDPGPWDADADPRDADRDAAEPPSGDRPKGDSGSDPGPGPPPEESAGG